MTRYVLFVPISLFVMLMLPGSVYGQTSRHRQPTVDDYILWCVRANPGFERVNDPAQFQPIGFTVHRIPLRNPRSAKPVAAEFGPKVSVKDLCHPYLSEFADLLARLPDNGELEGILPAFPPHAFKSWRRGFTALSWDSVYLVTWCAPSVPLAETEYSVKNTESKATISKCSIPLSDLADFSGLVDMPDRLGYMATREMGADRFLPGPVWAIPKVGKWRKLEGVRATALAASPDGKSVLLCRCSRSRGKGGLDLERRSADLRTRMWRQVVEREGWCCDFLVLLWSADQKLVAVVSVVPPPEDSHDTISFLFLSAMDGKRLGTVRHISRDLAVGGECAIIPESEEPDLRKLFGLHVVAQEP